MAITGADFTAVLKSLGAGSGLVLPAADLALGATRALAGLSPVAQAVFLATMTQESDYFRATQEYGSDRKRYDPYRGRTFDMVTFDENYAAFGAWAKGEGLTATASLFVDRPELLAETQWAWLGGVWYFGMRKLWPYADDGDFQTVQVKVQGTSPFPPGWTARLAAYRAWTARVVKPAALPVNGLLDAATGKRLQQWVGVGMDGAVGKVTYSAIQKWLGLTVDGSLSVNDIKKFQGVIGAYVDGDWGPGTNKALQRFLNAQGGV